MNVSMRFGDKESRREKIIMMQEFGWPIWMRPRIRIRGSVRPSIRRMISFKKKWLRIYSTVSEIQILDVSNDYINDSNTH